MVSRRSAVPLALLLLLQAGAAAAQDPPVLKPASMKLSSASAAATAHFEAGMRNADYLSADGAAAHLKQALDADPSWGLARVLHAQYAPGLTRDQRIAEMNRGVADAAQAPAAELLAALTYRERFVNGPVAARPLARALTEMVPDEPRFAVLDALRGGLTEQERIAAIREVVRRFPDYGAPYNFLAYDLWRTGDHAGALEAAETQVRLAGDEANPHDTYAELLQWSGRLDEARTHYRHAAERGFYQGYAGIAEIEHLQGRGAQARATLAAAIEQATAPAARLYLKEALAISHLADGNEREAQRILGEAAQEAEAQGDRGRAGFQHVRMALVDAALGKGRGVSAHLAQAAAADELDEGYAALAYALAGQADSARAYAGRFSERAAKSPNPVMRRNAHVVSGYALLAAGQCAQALEEFGQGDPGGNPVAQAGMAACHQKMGNRAEARALRDRVLGSREFAVDDEVGAAVRARMRRMR